MDRGVRRCGGRLVTHLPGDARSKGVLIMRIQHALAVVVAATLSIGSSAFAQSGGASAQESGASSVHVHAHVLYSSALWKKDSNAITGVWRIEDRGDGRRALVLDSSFKTKSAPDLKLVFSTESVEKVTKKNVLKTGRVLSLLQSNTGAQEYELPADLDLTKYRTLAIHCEQYTKLWGASALSEGEVLAHAPSWTKKTKKTKGGYEIVRRSDGVYIRFASDFKTAKAPEPLRVILSPLTPKEAKNKNAEDGGVLIATLSSVKGGQEYLISEDVDFAKFNSVLLNCKKYTKLWSAAALSIE